MESVRKEVEKTNCLQGLIFTHSTGGGTGSGLGMRLLQMVKETQVPTKACTYSFAVFPSKKSNHRFFWPFIFPIN